MFLMAHRWGVQPGEFWGMTLSEWFLLFDANRPKATGDFAGSLTQGDVERLSDLIEDD